MGVVGVAVVGVWCLMPGAMYLVRCAWWLVSSALSWSGDVVLTFDNVTINVGERCLLNKVSFSLPKVRLFVVSRGSY